MQLQQLQLSIDSVFRASINITASPSTESSGVYPRPLASDRAVLPLLLTTFCHIPHPPIGVTPHRRVCISSEVLWSQDDAAARVHYFTLQLPPCTAHLQQSFNFSLPIPPPSIDERRVQMGDELTEGRIYVAAFELYEADDAASNRQQCTCGSSASSSSSASAQQPCAEFDAPLLWLHHTPVTLAAAALASAT